ncbi:unnamed protein product [Cylicocyclus nassatus]|uniref:Uncharacterized protein n=1 Tax=Cylicocyclus nassatus TaxID=53992 RepID=A0AA36HFZ5_CYLNA|nr:unnamed protein product [Cylicocyclus nassatus]
MKTINPQTFRGTSHGGRSKDIDDTFEYWRGLFSYFLEDGYEVEFLKSYTFAELADAKTTEIGCAYYDVCDGNEAYTFFCFTNQA